LRDEDHIVPGFLEMLHQVDVLTRKILVDEQEIHRSRDDGNDAVAANSAR
jgi:hypothetical protein